MQDQIKNMGNEDFPIWENAKDIEASRKVNGEEKVALTKLQEVGKAW